MGCSFTPFQLLSLLKESLEKQNKLTYDSLYTCAADLLSYLSIKAKSDSKTGKDEEEEKLPQNFCHILKWFWEGFSSICLENLESGSGKVVNIIYCSLFVNKTCARKQENGWLPQLWFYAMKSVYYVRACWPTD